MFIISEVKCEALSGPWWCWRVSSALKAGAGSGGKGCSPRILGCRIHSHFWSRRRGEINAVSASLHLSTNTKRFAARCGARTTGKRSGSCGLFLSSSVGWVWTDEAIGLAGIAGLCFVWASRVSCSLLPGSVLGEGRAGARRGGGSAGLHGAASTTYFVSSAAC